MENTNSPISQNERLLAAASHASILMPVTGSILPLVIWLSQKEKSQFVRIHSLQAFTYQLSLAVFFIASTGCLLLSLLVGSTTITVTTPDGKQVLNSLHDISLLYQLLILIIFPLSGFLFSIYGVLGAIKSFRGKPFQYIFIGKQIKKYSKSNENTNTIE